MELVSKIKKGIADRKEASRIRKVLKHFKQCGIVVLFDDISSAGQGLHRMEAD